MNDLDVPALKGPPPRPLLPAPDRDTPEPRSEPRRRGGPGRRLLALGVLVLLMASLALGAWRHYEASVQDRRNTR
jgi:hypothetical protein